MKSSERRMPLAGGRLITNLRVSELKKELEKRGLSTEGVKVVLTVRLNKALRDEGLDPADHQFERIASPQKRITRKSSEMSKQAAVVNENSEKGGKSEEIPNKIDEMEAVVDEEGVERDVHEGEDVVKENDEKREDTVEDYTINQLLDDSNDDLEIIEEEIEELQKEYKEEKDVELLKNNEFETAVRVVPDALEKRKDVVDEPKYKGKQKTVEVPEVVTIEDSDEPEGEDEFEEEMEPPIEPETTSHVAGTEEKMTEVCEKINNDVKATPIFSSTSSAIPADDEMFLDYEEDLLEDPLDEQPTPDRPPSKENNNIATSLKDEQLTKNTTSSPVRKANTVPPIQKSTSSSTPGGGGADSGSFLFADDAKKTSIWIRGMTPQTKASSVKQLASQYGKVVQSKIFNSRPINGEVKNCFALVTFADTAAMELSIVSLHKKNYQGRVLRVEKVSESHLTNSAEKIAKEKRAAEEIDKKMSASESPEGTKKRAIITAPELGTPPSAPRRERQSIQAPPAAHSSHEDPKPRPAKRPAIQPPERSRSRESQRHHRDSSSSSRSTRKVITFRGADQIPDAERDSRHTIAAPVGPKGSKGVRLTPPLAKRSARAGSAQRGGPYREDAPGSESLIISARVDTSGCRGGGMTIKRSIERSVPNNISTSELRRNQIHTGGGLGNPLVPPILPGARASYQTEKYAREHRSGSCSKRRPSPDRGNRRQRDISERGNEGRRRQEEPPMRRYPHSASLIPEEPPRRRQHDEQAEREKAMLEILRRKEEEHLIREEKLRLEKEREKMKFEAEKLEKAKLELELMKQKLVLQQAAMNIQRSDGVRSADNREADGRRSSRGGVGSSSSRRRPAGEALTSNIAAKIRTDDRTDSRSRRDTGERSRSHRGEDRGGRNTSSSNRASSTSYGIQTAGVLPTRGHNSSDYTTSSANNYRTNGDGGSTTSTYGNQGSIGGGGGYQSYTTQYQDPSFQVWGGLDAQGHMPMDTNWTTGATPSTSTSSGGSQWQHTSYNTASSNTSGRRQDYQYRSNY